MELCLSLAILSVIGLWIEPMADTPASYAAASIPSLIFPTITANLFPDNLPSLHEIDSILRVEMPQAQLDLLSVQAHQMTVKVLVGQDWGSGTIVDRQGSNYTVLTNQHVLDGQSNYQVQTFDGQVHEAFLNVEANLAGNDLALLQFSSEGQNYEIATFGKSQALQVGDAVFAGGFPAIDETDRSSAASQPSSSPTQLSEASTEIDGFQFISGRVALMSRKPLEGGYQIGYTNTVIKGMSGGPVLNAQGEVIAINGMHPYPLWGDPYVFMDGSRPCEPLRQLMIESSWAIPVETVVKLLPTLTITPNTIEIVPSEWVERALVALASIEQISQLQHRAEISEQCLLNEE
jgi:S1-C subfamily serine protease